MEKKLNSNYTKMLQAILNKSWRQHPTKQQLPPITNTIQVRWTRHAGHCWRSKDELISNIPLWTPSHGWAARTYIQLCADTGCSLEDLSRAIDDRDGRPERVKEIYAGRATWWWWYTYIHTYIYTHIYIHTHIHTHIYIYTHTHTYIYIYIYIYTHTHIYQTPQLGQDMTRSIFKRSLTGLNSEFSFS